MYCLILCNFHSGAPNSLSKNMQVEATVATDLRKYRCEFKHECQIILSCVMASNQALNRAHFIICNPKTLI